MARLRTATATSAGGVVYRYVDQRPEFVLCGRRDTGAWGLPKGTPAAGETLEQTAVREAQEESGLRVRVVCPLHSIDYWFVVRGTRFHKTVHFYLMEAVGGDVSLHDHEYDDVQWFPAEEAPERLTYPNEIDITRRALVVLKVQQNGRATT
ncbi:MAG TPA: NUDIX hydrolase [Chloroflexota bacterium]|nr:NUDIX hydrolase [Chloroflexota bacterium]